MSRAFIDLFPFNVNLLLDVGEDTALPRVDVFTMTNIIVDWLEISFSSNSFGDDYAKFQRILLDYEENRDLRRQLQNTAVFTASFEGAAVWNTEGNLTVPTEAEVLSLQLEALVENEPLLLELLQLSQADGLGDTVMAVDASLDNGDGAGGGNSGTNNDDSLDIVIIVAIVIAGIAFVLLVFALFMAWRYRNTAGGTPSQSARKRNPNEATGSESDYDNGLSPSPSKRQSRAANEATAAPPSEIDPSEEGGGVYPESLISEDISTSLTAYYRSGMGTGPLTRGRNTSGVLNDAASVSSMESYGYSLDGYASSMIGGKEDDPY